MITALLHRTGTILLVTVLSTLLGLSAGVHAASVDDVRALRSLLDRMTSLEGTFTQTLTDGKGVQLEESYGRFSLQRPGKFYWKTETPFEQLLVSNHKTIWLYDPDLEQVTVRQVTEDMQQTPATLLSDDVQKLQLNFEVTRKQINRKKESFELVPKSDEGLFQKLVLTFTDRQLQTIEVLDGLQQTSLFFLNNVIANKPVDESLFEFTPPPGVDVLID